MRKAIFIDFRLFKALVVGSSPTALTIKTLYIPHQSGLSKPKFSLRRGSNPIRNSVMRFLI